MQIDMYLIFCLEIEERNIWWSMILFMLQINTWKNIDSVWVTWMRWGRNLAWNTKNISLLFNQNHWKILWNISGYVYNESYLQGRLRNTERLFYYPWLPVNLLQIFFFQSVLYVYLNCLQKFPWWLVIIYLNRALVNNAEQF